MKNIALLCVLTAAAPLSAQTAVATTAQVGNEAAPAAAAVSVPAEGSALATDLAGKLFPYGTYRKMLGPAMTQMMSGMSDSMGAMPIGPFLKAAGLPESDAAKMDKATLGEIMAILDPAYKERMRRTMDGMFAAMIPLFEKLEPDLRAGLAVSLDKRFTATQLTDLRSFFATPTGSAFASQQMLLFMDPAVMGRMQTAMPKIMQELPGLIATAAKSTADLPKAKSYKDLTTEERDRLAKLLGVDPKKLNK